MVVSEDNAEHYQWGDNCDGCHLVKTPVLSVIKERVPSGCGEIRHYQHRSEQFFFVVLGVASLEVDGHINLLEAQQGLHISAGIAHQLRNDQQCDLIFLVTSVPPSHGDRIASEEVSFSS